MMIVLLRVSTKIIPFGEITGHPDADPRHGDIAQLEPRTTAGLISSACRQQRLESLGTEDLAYWDDVKHESGRGLRRA